MSRYKASYAIQFVSRKAMIPGQKDRVKPKLGDVPFAFHMNVRRLALIGTKEDKGIRAIFKHSRDGYAF